MAEWGEEPDGGGRGALEVVDGGEEEKKELLAAPGHSRECPERKYSEAWGRGRCAALKPAILRDPRRGADPLQSRWSLRSLEVRKRRGRGAPGLCPGKWNRRGPHVRRMGLLARPRASNPIFNQVDLLKEVTNEQRLRWIRFTKLQPRARHSRCPALTEGFARRGGAKCCKWRPRSSVAIQQQQLPRQGSTDDQ